MWNRRRDEDVQPRPLPSSSDVIPREVPVPPPAPSSRALEEPAALRGTATIGKSVVVKGHISSREDIYLDGELEGTLEAKEHRVTIGPHGKITTSGIVAREIVILGNVHGNAEATDKVEIRKDARLVGDLRTARIVIEDGAFFKGSVDIVKAEPKPAPPPPKAPAAPAPEATAAPAPKQQPLTTAPATPVDAKK